MLQIRREILKSIKICNDTAWVKRTVLSEKNTAGAKYFEKKNADSKPKIQSVYMQKPVYTQ